MGFFMSIIETMDVGLPFNRLLDHIPEALLVLNLENEIIFINEKAKKFETLSSSAFYLGVPFPDIVPAERKEMVEYILNEVKSKKISRVTEAEYKDRDQRSYFFEAFYDPVFNEANKIEYVCVFFREKTTEKIFEKKSTQLLNDFSYLIEHANAVIFSVDSTAYITEWNSESERVTQFHKNIVLAQKIELFIEDHVKDEFSVFLDEILKGNPASNFELYFKTKSGPPVIILVNATPKVNNSGEVVGVLFVGHDITELSEYRKSLEEKIKDRTEKLRLALEKEKELVDLKNRFVSMASHEFRVPLSTISSSVNSIKLNSGLHKKDHEKIQTIEKQIGHMRALIDDVLTLGKTNANKLKPTQQKFDLISFLEKIMGEVMVNAQNSHKVRFKYSSPVIEIDSDEKLLRNIFINLISNAIKFSPEHDTVYVTVDLKDTWVAVQVADRGIGIDVSDVTRIFEPFNRGSNTGAIKGTGLGLSIVKRAVEALGGTIALDSKVNAGTTITVKLKAETITGVL
jgi:PAS domain S-box-containing protein